MPETDTSTDTTETEPAESETAEHEAPQVPPIPPAEPEPAAEPSTSESAAGPEADGEAALIAALEAEGITVLYTRDGKPVIQRPQGAAAKPQSSTSERSQLNPSVKLDPLAELQAVRAANLQRLGITD